MAIQFPSEKPAITLLVPLQMRLHMEGLHFAEVYVDERLLTRVPLEVVYVRRPAATTPSSKRSSTRARAAAKRAQS